MLKIDKIKAISLKKAVVIMPHNVFATNIIFYIFSLNGIPWKWRPIRTWLKKVHYFTIYIEDLKELKNDTWINANGAIRDIEKELEEIYDCTVFASHLSLTDGIYRVDINVRFHNEDEVAFFILNYG